MTENLRDYFGPLKWGGKNSETNCGRGSTLSYTEKLRAELPAFLRQYEVKRFLDAPCGDFNWMKEIDLGDVDYVGMDIVEEFIEKNTERHGGPKRTFLVGDITSTPLPQADVMLCRDCLFHLRYVDIYNFLQNFIRSEIPLLLLTSHVSGRNSDLPEPGGFRPMNMQKAPFNFPEPIMGIEDWVEPFPVRFVNLWTREQVAQVLDAAQPNFADPAAAKRN